MRLWVESATSRTFLASRLHHARGLNRLCSNTAETRTRRSYSTSNQTILNIPKANVYRFGDPNKASPVFKDLEWTIRDGESWAIVGPAGNEKTQLLEMLLGYMRLHPSPPGGMFPFLSSKGADPHSSVSLVSFTARRAAGGGAFVDYTARYGAVREEDRLTLREALFSDHSEGGANASELEVLAERLDLKRLLDLPFIVLSNGQTRRARVARALLRRPEILLLDEPLTGLDVNHRPKLTDLLKEIHETGKPRILMSLRPQDPLPNWITHVAAVDGTRVSTGPRALVSAMPAENILDNGCKQVHSTTPDIQQVELVHMKDVNVRYHERHILKNVEWVIRAGERWHLKGANGSGKTTLLSLITGDHPQSYTQASSNFRLFSQPRRRLPTSTLARKVGIASPEIFNAFPRRLGPSALSVKDAIATGFEGTYSYRPRSGEMDERIDELLRALGPRNWSTEPNQQLEDWSERPFAALSSGEQSLVLLMRALVGRAPLVILDEVFAGMDSRMISVARAYLRDKLDPEQAVVFVTHWEEEVPWNLENTRKLTLSDGVATIS
ncbi:P-loop containing nucleoside triphosphate hydrolase protein [Schizopora paradoxa]|uniref:p-loop containing nucleoside triphosphate hydrolase protein n=1 Tax=Schizopora paradoxa TaxID=27342 RepID=A0A0H2RT02_9AGAM|nr:P-loop containing nucleoside triphosphate hydrolase protein [Schizopora paradoxa]